MKKLLSLILAIALLPAVFAGCEDRVIGKYQNSKNDKKHVEDVNNYKKDVKSEAEIVSAGENKPDIPAESIPKPPLEDNNKKPADKKAPPTPDKSSFIGEARAKEIALNRAGLLAADVVFEKLELDRDNGIWEYELEFRQGRVEYDVEIKADDGKILSFEKDIDD